jgi:hypothetical protein
VEIDMKRKTKWSAGMFNEHRLTFSTGGLLDKLMPRAQAYGFFWAEPSIKQAAAYVRDVYEHRDEACALRGQAKTQSLLSLEAAGQRMRDRLEQIVAV